MTKEKLTEDQKARLNRLVGLGIPFNRALKIVADNLPLTKEEREDASVPGRSAIESEPEQVKIFKEVPFKVALDAGMIIERCSTGLPVTLAARIEVEAIKDRGFILFHINGEEYRLYLRKYFLKFDTENRE